ncbi:appetite-regulating hormone [Pelodiscus sinensis]|uniref:Appetite-regulating hormone n=1 Tax=Pelodiscus sinensis TaxID=13735 RepID=X1WI36_PELSI|nr:appetite-regulating hormone [Pelodiscus sinensis]|eukprot:XP_006132884.1 appetite-regulating hormone [Pelodiscus sinensis]
MFLRSTKMGILLLCILWTETAMTGSSFLSPEYQNTQQRKEPKKHTKLNRRATQGFLDADARQAEGDNEIEIKLNVPFEIGVKITEDQYQEYGQVLEKILEDVLAEDTKEIQTLTRAET